MKTENVKIMKPFTVYLNLEYFEKLKELRGKGEATSRTASNIIMNYIDNNEKNKLK